MKIKIKHFDKSLFETKIIKYNLELEKLNKIDNPILMTSKKIVDLNNKIDIGK